MRASLLLLVFVAGCSAAIGDGSGGGAEPISDGPDAGAVPEPDAGPAALVLDQSSRDDISPQNSIACVVVDANNVPTEHKDDAFYRVYDLGALGIDEDLEVDEVQVGIEQATSPTGSQPATVALYTLTAGFTVAELQPLTSVPVTVANQGSGILTVPVVATVPGRAKLVVEFSVPDSAGKNELLWIGSNSAPQSGPSFWRSTACQQAEPRDLALAGSPDMHVVLKVVGHTR